VAAVNDAVSILSPRVAFTQETIMDDLVCVLADLGFRFEQTALVEQSSRIALAVLRVMHRTVCKLDTEGEIGRLDLIAQSHPPQSAEDNASTTTLATGVTCVMPSGLRIATEVFTTRLNPADWCTSDFLQQYAFPRGEVDPRRRDLNVNVSEADELWINQSFKFDIPPSDF